jgi:hypothetical protein
MAKRIMRLTESDLVRLVRKVVKEQDLDRGLGGDVHKPVVELNDKFVLVEKGDSQLVSRVLNSLPKNLKFLALIDCEYADFSDVNLCDYQNLTVRLKGTENNLEETQDECYDATPALDLYVFGG